MENATATILACTDGSSYAPSVYGHAAWAASRTAASVLALHVIERPEMPAVPDLSGNLGFDANAELLAELASLDETHARVARLRGTAILEDAARQLAEHRVVTLQRHGSLVETLAEFEETSSLVVIGKRGEQAHAAQAHLGSNLERVVRSVNIPVLVAARAFRPIERFLVAFDGGPSALKAVQHIADGPLLRGIECHLVAVGKPGSPLASALTDAAKILQTAGFAVTADLISGDPDEAIAAEVRSREINLLVMGAYGHSRVRQFILGSTTTTLVRTCLVPVLLFR